MAANEDGVTGIDLKLAKLDGDMTLVKWMLGILLAGVARSC